MPKYPYTSETRVFSIVNRAGPANVPAYQGCWKAGSLTKPKGEPKIVTCPDPSKYGAFKVVEKIPGEIGLPGLTITAQYTQDISDLLAMLNRGCDVDLQIHIGRCADPSDFVAGWEKIIVLEGAQPGDYSIADLGALEQGDQKAITEEMPFKGMELYEVVKMAYEKQAEVEVVQEIIAIMVCDVVSCGMCGDPSEGCEKVFALTLTMGGSPGARAEVIFTGDAGTTWDDTEVDTLPVDKDPSDMACVGTYLVVISNDDVSLHYAPKADILAGTETRIEVVAGFVGAGAPNAIFSLSPRHTWIVGDGGYVYFTENPTIGVTVQTAGTVVTNDLLAIHGYDTENLVAVGKDNIVIVTRNGGDVWTWVNGPQVAQDNMCVWMKGPDEWFVGNDLGNLFWTVDGGATWTQKILPLQATLIEIADIKFSTPTVGWLAAKTATPAGMVMRSIDGGYEWYVVPEGNLPFPTNDRINEIGTCEENPNVIYAGGLAGDGLDGIIVKGS